MPSDQLGDRGALGRQHQGEPEPASADGQDGGRGVRAVDPVDVDDLIPHEDLDVDGRTDGVAHACGHDAHTVAVLGAARALAALARDSDVAGTVRLVFEPAEESVPGGASGMVTATFGYILGFVLAAAVVGLLAQRGWTRSPWRTFASMLVGSAVIYAVGVPWLKAAVGVTWSQAVSLGLTPFLVGDLLKAALAAGIFTLAWRWIDARRSA